MRLLYFFVPWWPRGHQGTTTAARVRISPPRRQPRGLPRDATQDRRPHRKHTRDGGRWACAPAHTDENDRRHGSRRHRRDKQSPRTRAPPQPDDSSQRGAPNYATNRQQPRHKAPANEHGANEPPSPPPQRAKRARKHERMISHPPTDPTARRGARDTPPDAHDSHPQTRVPASDEQPRARAEKKLVAALR